MFRNVEKVCFAVFFTVAFMLLVAADSPNKVEIYKADKLAYSTEDFQQVGNRVFLPLEESARSIGLEGFSDPKSKVAFMRNAADLVIIDSKKKTASVNGQATKLSFAPVWTDSMVYIPGDVYTKILPNVVNDKITLFLDGEPIHVAKTTDIKKPSEKSGLFNFINKKKTDTENDGPADEKNPEDNSEKPADSGKNPVDVIVIDPGHGGHDSGARGPDGIKEKDVVLMIAKKLEKKLLEEKGIQVHLTRTDDTFISLSKRPQKAKELKADVFVSVHANGFKRISAQGFETFFASLTATDEAAYELALWENQAEGEEDQPPEGVMTDLELILGDMAQTESLADSQSLAEMVQENMSSVMKSDNRGVKQAPFKVLMESSMPAVLVEIGFLTSPTEAKQIMDPETQDKIVDAIADAILKYRKQTNARLGLAPKDGLEK
jgi:N-acetylmuramoyl-L-alanine amidase